MIHILISFFNRKQLTLECLESFSKQNYKNYSITVVDDGSTDGSSAAIKNSYPNVGIIRTKGDLWWAKSMNVGLKAILPKTKVGDFVLIINQDTEVKPDYLEKLVEASQTNNRAVVGSLVKNFYDENLIQDAGTKALWSTYSFPKDVFNSSQKTNANIDMLTTRGILIPVEVFKKIGLFTRLLPHHAADLNFSMKARRAGFILVMSNEGIVYSKEHSGEKVWSFWTRYFSRRSSSNLGANITFALLNAPTVYLKIKCVVLILGRFIKTLANNLFQNKMKISKK
jgi:GT2 family glycosyltransferase